MTQFESVSQEFANSEIAVVFIAAEKHRGFFKPESFFHKHPSSFPFLLDEDRSVTKTWGVYQRLRADAFNIARPATFVVDRGGMIRWIYVGKNQTDRPGLEEVLSHAAASR